MIKIDEFINNKVLKNIPLFRKFIFFYLKSKNPLTIEDLKFQTKYSNSYALISEKNSKIFKKINDRLDCYFRGGAIGPNKRWEYPWVLTNLRLRRGLKILDVGCGQSPIQFLLSDLGLNVFGIDPNENTEWHGINRKLANFYGCSIKYQTDRAEKIQFPDNTFDRVCCVSVIEHIRSKEIKNPEKRELTKDDLDLQRRIMNEIIRVLKPGGICVITVDFFIPRDNLLLKSNVNVKNLMDIRNTEIVGNSIKTPFFGEKDFKLNKLIRNSDIDIVNYCDILQTSIGFTLRKIED